MSKDDEIEELKGRLFETQNAAIELNAHVAMLMNALRTANTWLSAEGYKPDHPVREALREALYPYKEDVIKFLDGVRADAVAEYRRQAQATMCAKVVR